MCRKQPTPTDILDNPNLTEMDKLVFLYIRPRVRNADGVVTFLHAKKEYVVRMKRGQCIFKASAFSELVNKDVKYFRKSLERINDFYSKMDIEQKPYGYLISRLYYDVLTRMDSERIMKGEGKDNEGRANKSDKKEKNETLSLYKQPTALAPEPTFGKEKGETQRNPKNPSGFSETQRNPEKPKKADSDSDSDSTNNEQIDIIRKLYPHVTGRSNKKKSSTILQKLLEDFTLETIKREIQLLKLNIEIGQQNPSFVPGLQVWLNNFSVTLPNVYVKTISLYRQLHKEDKNKEALYKRWIDNYPQQRKLGTEEFRKSQSINLSSFK